MYSKEGTYTLYILNGEFNNDWELILRKECAFDELGWNEVVFDNPVDLDCTRDLWVVFSAPSTNHYPAYFRDYNGPGVEDAAYIGGTMDYFYQMSGISWLIKVNLTDSNFTYRLEKNGMQLATGLTTRTFMDDDLSSGTFNYQVWCSFGGVECDESASCSISLGRVEVSTSDLEAGTVQGGGLAEVGSQMTVTATPNDGYVFRGWVIDGEVVSDDEEYSFTVSGDISLQAVFAYTYNYNISATVEPSEGGSVSGTGLYVEGESCTLVAEPHENYVFIAWKEGGTEISTDDHYTFTVEGPRDFVAVFAKKYLTIQASAGLGGTITPRGTVTVERGEDVTFTMSPNTGCSVLQVSVDDDEVGDVQSYTFTNVTENHTIHVQFKGYGVDEDVAEVRIIPNPVKDQLHVESPTIIYQYEIITVNGVMVERKTVCNSCMDCRLEGFAEGVYFLRLFTDEGVITKKIIVSE